MQEEEALRRLVEVWDLDSEGKGRKYSFSELKNLIRGLRIEDPDGMITSLTARDIIEMDMLGRYSLTKKGNSLIPEHRLKNLGGTDSAARIVSSESDWSDFRQLIAYYIECVRSQEVKEFHLYPGASGVRFCIPETINPLWLKAIDSPDKEGIVLRFRPYEQAMMNAIIQQKADERNVCIGYPVEVGFDDNGAAFRYTPVALLPVRYSRSLVSGTQFNSRQEIEVSLDYRHASFNYEWVNRNCEMEFFEEIIESLGDEENDFDMAKDLPKLLAYSKYRNQDFSPMTAVQALPQSSRRGRHYELRNTVMLFRLPESFYTRNLIRELEAVRKADPAELDKTALAYIYRKRPLSNGTGTDYIPIPVLDSNKEQLEAVSAAFSNHVSVVQGPPGTGKSQMALNLVANCIYRDKSVVFSTKNNAALDAINSRQNREGLHLVKFCREADSKDDRRVATNDWHSLDVAAERREIEKRPGSGLAEQKLTEAAEAVKEIRKTYDDEERLLQDYLKVEHRYQEAQHRLDTLMHNTGGGISPEQVYEKAQVILRQQTKGGLFKFLRQSSGKKAYEEAKAGLLAMNVLPSFSSASDKALLSFCEEFVPVYEEHNEASAASRQAYKLYEENKRDESLVERYVEASEVMRANSRDALDYHRNMKVAGLSKEDYRNIDKAFGLQRQNPRKLTSDDKFSIELGVRTLHELVPAWSIPLLSAVHAAPLIPGLFDMAVIDEASQCDCVSMIPMLYRAKSTVLIGDPLQFKPVTGIKKRRHDLIWDSYLKDKQELRQRFSFLENSAYSVVASFAPKGMLRSHFRCSTDIAEYINEVFYDDQLRVCTDTDALQKAFPLQLKGIGDFNWIDVPTGLDDEISSCVGLVSQLRGKGYEGTIGVISPLKEVSDKLSSRMQDPGLNVKVSTVYGFQGSECDLIIFVLGFTDELRRGQLWYMTASENRNIFNVAISRAKSCLFVIGDKKRCEESSSDVLRKLAEYPRKEEAGLRFDTDMEERLYYALKDKGISTTPQYPFRGYRFDLAYIDDRIKLDIEVDGYQYHYNSDGTRKGSDIDRDRVVMEFNWKPLRFLWSELNNDMDGCVNEIINAISIAHRDR